MMRVMLRGKRTPSWTVHRPASTTPGVVHNGLAAYLAEVGLLRLRARADARRVLRVVGF